MIEQDRADRLSDRVEQKTIAKCAGLYTEALRRVMRRFSPLLKELEQLETRKPPSTYRTPEAQEEWREGERKRLIRKSGIEKAVAREIASAGALAADVIRAAMDEIDRINRVGDDIG